MDTGEVPGAVSGPAEQEPVPGPRAPGAVSGPAEQEPVPGPRAPGAVSGPAEREPAANPSAPASGLLGAIRQAAAAQASGNAGGNPPESAAALLGLLGGARGMLDSAVPGALFVAVYVATRNLTTPLLVAAGAALVMFVYRLARRDALRYAVGGCIGVAIAAGLAVLTGKPENYFLPALGLNAAYATVSAVSLAVRWPLIGVVLGTIIGEGTQWRRDPPRRRAYTATTVLWLGMFLLRIAVLFPLWLANLLVPLGVGRIVLGYPLYALVVWLTWLIISRTRPARPPAAAPAPGA